ncbi:MAG TPA: hypothetical protein VL098_12620 [Flavipsychrobacter sp.]|nr:hypothetical protein [Flavipsychrobacter sp.]
MAKSTKIILVVILVIIAIVGVAYVMNGKNPEEVPSDDTLPVADNATVDISGGKKTYAEKQQDFYQKVESVNSLDRVNVIKEARKSMLTGGLSGIVNSANNVTAAINKLFKKKK